VAHAIIGSLRYGPRQWAGPKQWEVDVFKSSDANAFALPGGKIGVYTGILKYARNQSQLATVLGHEITHVVAGHIDGRLSTAYVTRAGLNLIQSAVGNDARGKQIRALLGIGSQYGILLPFSRTQESEADLYGLQLMARAGFDPRQSIAFWRNMQRGLGPGPPGFLSDHPSGSSRSRDLQAHMAQAVRLYRQTRAAGRVPHCRPPG